MNLRDALAYAPILGSGLSPDGQRVFAVLPHYDPATQTRSPQLYTLDLANRGAWTRQGAAASALHSAAWAPDSQRLGAFRTGGTTHDLAIFDLREPEQPPTTPAGMPAGCVALKWWGAPGLPACVGLDPDGCRRVFVWENLTAPPRAITPARHRVADYAFAPGGERLAWLYGPPRGVAQPASASVLYLQDGLDASPVELPVPEPLLGFLAWSPDGRYLAALGRPLEQPLTAPRLWCVDTAERTCRRLLPELDGWITGYDWTVPGPELLVTVDRGVTGQLFRVPLDGAPTPLGPTDAYLSGVNSDRRDGRILHLQQDGHQPQHLRLFEPGASRSSRVSRFNNRLLKRPLRPQQTVRWTAPDGLHLEGLLMCPEGDGPHPMIVWLHGGPAEHIQRTFSAYFQVFCAAGFAVFAPNYRGSTGRDDAFLQALVGQLCGPDVHDVESGVRHLIRAGVAHRRGVGVVGWSYGGALALATAAAYPWVRAVVAGAPVVDWLTVFGAQTWPHVTRAYFDADPWVDPESYDRASPVRRLAGVKAPVLLLHGEEDERVPVAQSRLAYHLLLGRGTLTELRVFPGEGHVFSAPWAVGEMLARTVSWMRVHVGEEVGER